MGCGEVNYERGRGSGSLIRLDRYLADKLLRFVFEPQINADFDADFDADFLR